MKKAIVLNSGGLDSATCLAIAKDEGFSCTALSFDYDQRHCAELEGAKKLAACFDIPHKMMSLPSIGELGHSALTDLSIAVPDYSESEEVPITYVPARNTVFLSMALGLAEVIGAEAIFTGLCSTDHAGYPDTRPEYVCAFQGVIDTATRQTTEGKQIKLCTPLLHLTKAETILLGQSLGVDYSLSISCYQADEAGRACGRCDSCGLRREGFLEAGVPDPTRYVDDSLFV